MRFQTSRGRGIATVKRLALRSPNTNAYIERFVQSIKQECLDHFVIFGPEHMDVLVGEYVEHYHTERPHQGVGNMPLITGRPVVPQTPPGRCCAGCDSAVCCGTTSERPRDGARPTASTSQKSCDREQSVRHSLLPRPEFTWISKMSVPPALVSTRGSAACQ